MTKTQRIELLEQRVAELIGEVERLKVQVTRQREAEFYQPLEWAQVENNLPDGFPGSGRPLVCNDVTKGLSWMVNLTEKQQRVLDENRWELYDDESAS